MLEINEYIILDCPVKVENYQSNLAKVCFCICTLYELIKDRMR